LLEPVLHGPIMLGSLVGRLQQVLP
jgi:hypothetical protein